MSERGVILRLRSHAGQHRSSPPWISGSSLERSESGWEATQACVDAELGPYSYDLATPLNGLGWRAYDLILDRDEVLPAWERQFGPVVDRSAGGDPLFGFVVAAVRRLHPTVLIDMNLKLSREELLLLRREFPMIEVFVGWISTPKRFHRALYHDVLLTPCESIRQSLRSIGRSEVHMMQHAFNEKALLLPMPAVRPHHAVFSGSIHGAGHESRTEIVEALLAAGAIDAWVGDERIGAGSSERVPLPSSRQAGLARALPLPLLALLNRTTGRFGASIDARLGSVDTIPVRDPGRSDPSFDSNIHAMVHGREMFRLLGSARIVLHVGGDVPAGCAGALRLFEATGMGALLLTNHSEALGELFRLDEEVLTFRDAREAYELIMRLDEDRATLERIRLAGQARTLRDHTPRRRAEELSDILQPYVDGRSRATARWSRSR